MPPVRTGSVSSFTSSANSGSTSITVPSDATLVAIGISGYSSSAAGFFGGGTFTLNGVARSGVVAADTDTDMAYAAMFYWFLPATGSQTVAWDWVGTTAPAQGVLFAYGFYKDLDTTSVRSSSGTQADLNPQTTGTLTALTNDLIVTFVGTFVLGESTYTWAGSVVTPTEISEFTLINQQDGAWSETSPTGNQTISATGSQATDGGIAAIVLRPAPPAAAVIAYSYANYPKPKLAYPDPISER